MRKWAPQEVVLFLTLEVVLFLTLERPKSGTKTNSPAYIYIWLWGRLPPQKMPFLSFFPQFYSKKWPKRDVANLPRLFCSRSIEITQNWLETAVPSLFFQKSDWDCSFRPFYWFILGLNVKFVGLFGPKKALNCRNVKHVKLYLSKKG